MWFSLPLPPQSSLTRIPNRASSERLASSSAPRRRLGKFAASDSSPTSSTFAPAVFTPAMSWSYAGRHAAVGTIVTPGARSPERAPSTSFTPNSTETRSGCRASIAVSCVCPAPSTRL